MDVQTENPVRELPRRPGGYRAGDVDAVVGRLQAELHEAEQKLGVVRARLGELEQARALQLEREHRLRDILLEAQHEARELQQRAEAEREELVAVARRAAEERHAALESERVGLRSSLGELEAFERTLRLRTRFVFERALTDLPAEQPAPWAPAGTEAPARNGRSADGTEPAAPAPIPQVGALPGEETTVTVPPDEADEAPVEEPTTEESALAGAAVAETLPLSAVSEPEPEEPADQPAAPLVWLSSEGEDRIRILARPEVEDAPAPHGPVRPAHRRSLLVALAVLFALGGIAAAVGVLLTGDGSTSPPPATATTVETEPAATTGAEASGAQATTGEAVTEPAPATSAEQPAEEPAATPTETAGEEPATTAPPPALATITLSMTATSGDSWLEIRRGSATGQILFQGFLLGGESRSFEGKRLWARIGQPTSLTVKIDGKPAKGMPEGTADVVFTAKGVAVVGLG